MMDGETSTGMDGGAGSDQEALTAEIALLFAQEFKVAVGPLDHFLFLGGDSLMAESLATAISRRFAVKVLTATLLDAPTPRALAAVVAKRLAEARGRAATAVGQSAEASGR